MYLDKNLEDGVIFFYTHAVEDQNIIITFQTISDIQNYAIKLCHKDQKECLIIYVDLLDDSTYNER